MKKNFVSFTLTAAQRTAIDDAINALKTNNIGFANASPQQRSTLRKMGDDGFSYVNDVFQGLGANPQIIPASYDFAEFQKDQATMTELREIYNALLPYWEQLNDTMLLLGVDLMGAADDDYNLIKAEDKSNAALNLLAKEIGARFKKKKKATPPTP